MHDQSTQVNFPMSKTRIKHTSTTPDIYMYEKNQYNWTPRPKSLNNPDYLKIPPIRQYNLQDSLESISKERTPPFSSNSSIDSQLGKKLKNESRNSKFLSSSSSDKMYYHHQSCCNCHCCGSNTVYCRRNPATASQDLSWRRLHMSRAKLKATATTSELLSGFAMIAMVELQINEPTNVPEWLFVMFAVCTTILVAVHIFALMISTYLLPNIDAIAKLEVCEMVAESPHERMRGFIQLAWAFSTILGLFLFLVEVAILCWVKFWDYSFTAAIAATVIVIPVLIVFVLFAVHFYHSLVVYKCNASLNDMEKLEIMKKQLDEISIINIV